MHTASYWSATHAFPEFPAINRDIEVDVVVVGAGLTGITTAYLLKQEGARVALIERDLIATGETSRTTAHLTYVTDARLHRVVPMAAIQHRWMGQVVETDDGLPFIGENAHQEFIATGFCGNGFTLGTLSAMMARDRYFDRKNPWFDLFRVDRRPFHGGLWRYMKENLDYPYYLVRDRFAHADTDTLDDVHKGEGKIVRLHGQKFAAYRDDEGHVTVCSPVCTHLKCLVRWNAADRTWDCPCHGSRFHATGAVLSGPAEAPLEHVDLAGLQE